MLVPETRSSCTWTRLGSANRSPPCFSRALGGRDGRVTERCQLLPPPPVRVVSGRAALEALAAAMSALAAAMSALAAAMSALAAAMSALAAAAFAAALAASLVVVPVEMVLIAGEHHPPPQLTPPAPPRLTPPPAPARLAPPPAGHAQAGDPGHGDVRARGARVAVDAAERAHRRLR